MVCIECESELKEFLYYICVESFLFFFFKYM